MCLPPPDCRITLQADLSCCCSGSDGANVCLQKENDPLGDPPGLTALQGKHNSNRLLLPQLTYFFSSLQRTPHCVDNTRLENRREGVKRGRKKRSAFDGLNLSLAERCDRIPVLSMPASVTIFSRFKPLVLGWALPSCLPSARRPKLH